MKRFLFISLVLLCAAGCGQPQQTMNSDFLQLAADRYSVRSFDSKPVSRDIIDKIIKAGHLAPTAKNSQPQKIYVVTSEDVMLRLQDVSPCIYGAPQCFIICVDDERVCRRGENNDYGEIDASIVTTHMALEATALGVGTCIVGYFEPAKLKETLGLPENIRPVLMMPFGYPAADCVPSEKHTSFRDLGEVVEFY